MLTNVGLHLPSAAPARPQPRITFGLIVLNGEPFTRYLLRSIYPFAHEIIAVEGAAPAAQAAATEGGHSTDGTLETLRGFRDHEDPDHKLKIITAEEVGHPNGFWPGEKDEQSRAYAERATGDYLWQVDADEFYRAVDIEQVMSLLRSDPVITAISFRQVTFWGGFDYCVDGWYLLRQFTQVHRVFRWGPGYHYVTHRPPTITDERGRDLRSIQWLDGAQTAAAGIYMYHYSLVFPKQVLEKSQYYSQAQWTHSARAQQWADESFLHLRQPYHVHNVYEYPSWLERFLGQHPAQIESLRADLDAGTVQAERRPTHDIEKLLESPAYRLGRSLIQRLAPLAALMPLYLVWEARWRSVRRNPKRALGKLIGRQTGRTLE